MTALVDAERLGMAGRLDGVSLTLNAGELACLVGPNGSGKTSLLHALAGIGQPTGRVRINGIEPKTAAIRNRMKLLSFLPASRDVKWPLKAVDLIRLGASTADDRLHLDALLSELELGGFADRRIDRMSTGERARILLARALLSRPRLLLLDEPAANLDPLWQLKIMAELRALCRTQGQAMLVAMHDLDLARDYADRIIVMDGGRIAADGPPDQIMDGAEIPRIFGIVKQGGRWIPAA